MPIRFVSQGSSLGVLTGSVDSITSALTGVNTSPGTFTGTLQGAVAEITSQMSGEFVENSNYTGVLAGVLDNITSNISSQVTEPPAEVVTGIFVDATNGSDSYNGTSATYTGGSNGPKATVGAGIAACSLGDSLYLLNNNTYGTLLSFTTYDMDWNAGSTTAQAAELAGCYVSGGFPYRWSEASGQPKPVINFRMRSTNENFSLYGLEINSLSYVLRATNTNNFQLQYLDVARTGSDTSDVFWFNGSAGSKGFWVQNCDFDYAEASIDWADGNDMIKFNEYHDYIRVDNCNFDRAPHDCLSIAGSEYIVENNTFNNQAADGIEGYRACSFYAPRDSVGSSDGGEPYGSGLVQNNAFYGSNSPTAAEYTPPICKMQTKYGIFRFNSFEHNSTGTYPAIPHDLWQMQTCCAGGASEIRTAPLVASQRLYNNLVTVTGSSARRWIRQGTAGTDGTSGSENTRTEQHDNWVFNNHFQGVLNSSGEEMFEFQNIAASYRVGNAISQNKVEYNSFSDSTTSGFLNDATNGVQTLAQAEANWPAYVNNNTVGSSGGAGLGRDLAQTVGSGTSTTLTVDDAGVFQPRIYDADVGEIYAGDTLTVGGQTATVLTRDLTNNTLGLSTSVTWTAGQAVNLDGYLAGSTGIPGSDLLALPLVQSTDNIFSYDGTWQMPVEVQGDGVYGGGFAVSEDGSQLYANSYFGNIMKMTIPSVGGSSSALFADRSTPGSVPTAQTIFGACIEYNNELVRTKYADYVSTLQTVAFQKGNTNAQNMTGLFSISSGPTGRERMLSNGFMHIPSEWQELLGGPVASLGCRLSIIADAQCGYGFAVFDPADVTGNFPMTALLDYPYSNPLEPGDSDFPGWSPYNASGGVDLFSSTNAPLAGALIVPGSRTLLFITTHGYGAQQSPPASWTCRQGSSVGHTVYRVQCVAYDLQDLVDVKNGLANAADVQPYDWWEWASAYGSGGSHWNSCVGEYPMMPGWGVYDPVNSKWMMCADVFSRDMYQWTVNGL